MKNIWITAGATLLFVAIAGAALMQESKKSLEAPEPVVVLTNETLSDAGLPNQKDTGDAVSEGTERDFSDLYQPRPDELYNPQKSTNLLQRVEALTHGITVGIPVQFDTYGLKIRQLMQDVGEDDFTKGTEHLKSILPSIKEAQDVSDEWYNEIQNEIEKLETLVAQRERDTKITSLFRFNKSKVNTFLSELKVWISKNEELYELMIGADGEYRFDIAKRPTFNDRTLSPRFYRLFRQRQEAAERMRGYPLFRNTKI